VQQAVEQHGWLTAAQMIDGLALGETTPGPLIMVVAFVGFVGAWTHAALGAGASSPAGIAGACVATFFTFLPSFLFILAGGPLVEATHGDARVHRAADRHHGRGRRRRREPRRVLRRARVLAAGTSTRAAARRPRCVGGGGLRRGRARAFAFRVGVIPLVLAGALAGLVRVRALVGLDEAELDRRALGRGPLGRAAARDLERLLLAGREPRRDVPAAHVDEPPARVVVRRLDAHRADRRVAVVAQRAEHDGVAVAALDAMARDANVERPPAHRTGIAAVRADAFAATAPPTSPARPVASRTTNHAMPAATAKPSRTRSPARRGAGNRGFSMRRVYARRARGSPIRSAA
jgi:hypothetical protein